MGKKVLIPVRELKPRFTVVFWPTWIVSSNTRKGIETEHAHAYPACCYDVANTRKGIETAILEAVYDTS